MKKALSKDYICNKKGGIYMFASILISVALFFIIIKYAPDEFINLFKIFDDDEWSDMM